ncbi:50S ribosomal protein L20 [Acholeplasma granularum]|uniref:50S ribosomal protein L20 n=1 Tax=Acholeplasma granularum TaxID=264635 RepID=UPI000470E763
MARVTNTPATRRRRKKVLKLAKGYFGSKRSLYRTANEQVMRSLMYAYRDRKQNKRNFRKLWISRINAAAVANDFKYSKLVHGLSIANVELNRKVLADLAISEPAVFTNYVNLAKDAIANPTKYAKQVVAPKAEVKQAPKAEAKKDVANNVDLVAELSKLLVADLRPAAVEAGIENASSLKKAELVEALAKIGYNPNK